MLIGALSGRSIFALGGGAAFDGQKRTGSMLGADKSRGYCLEMIRTDFLAGANLESGNSKALLLSLERIGERFPALRKWNFSSRSEVLHECEPREGEARRRFISETLAARTRA